MTTNLTITACNYFFYVILLGKNGETVFSTLLSLHYNFVHSQQFKFQ